MEEISQKVRGQIVQMGGLGACWNCGLLCNISHDDVIWLQLRQAVLRLHEMLSFMQIRQGTRLHEFDKVCKKNGTSINWNAFRRHGFFGILGEAQVKKTLPGSFTETQRIELRASIRG